MVVYLDDMDDENFNDEPLLRVIYPLVDGNIDKPLPFGFVLLPESERKAKKDNIPLFFSSIKYQEIKGELHIEPSHYKGTQKVAVYEESEDEQVYEK